MLENCYTVLKCSELDAYIYIDKLYANLSFLKHIAKFSVRDKCFTHIKCHISQITKFM